MVVVVRSYWPQSLYCQMDKTGDCGRTSPQRNIHSDIPFLKIQGKGGKERMAPLAEEDKTGDCGRTKNRALAPHERSAVPLGTDHCPVG